jgi:hypothetical protein
MEYLIPAVLSVIGGLILWAIKRERVSLTYEIARSEVFPRAGTSGMYFVCTLRNGGNRPIENISYKFTVSGGIIDSVEFSDSKLIDLDAENQSTLEGSIALLNPKEKFGAIVTITDATDQSTSYLEARAVGATAFRESAQLMPEYLHQILLALAVAVTGSAAYSTWTSYRQSEVRRSIEIIGDVRGIATSVVESEKTLEQLKKESEDLRKKIDRDELAFKQGRPEREHIVFSILNKSGTGFIVPLLLASGDELPYWKTGLYLVHGYLADKRNARRYIDTLVSLSRVEEIAPSSRGFLLYLAGKIEQDQGNSKRAIELFDQCKNDTPLMYDHLMSQDPAYDLQSLKKPITSNAQNMPNNSGKNRGSAIVPVR